MHAMVKAHHAYPLASGLDRGLGLTRVRASAATLVVLRSFPDRDVLPENFELRSLALPNSLEADELLIENRWLSLDASTRIRMRATGSKYMPNIRLGEPISGFAVGEVLVSRRSGFAKGDLVLHSAGWRTHAHIRADEVGWRGPHRIEPETDIPEQSYLSALGPAGLTAYIGMTRLLAPKPGEVVYVSAAGGGIGSLVVQLGRIVGARIIASAGSEAKREHVRSLGADIVLDRHTPDLAAGLRSAAPDGLHGYFDCVGGPELEAAIANCRNRARIVMCGTVSNYDSTESPAPRNLFEVVGRELSIVGYLTRSYAGQLPQMQKDMAAWMRAGQIRDTISIVDGIQSVPRAFGDLFRGRHSGKLLIRL